MFTGINTHNAPLKSAAGLLAPRLRARLANPSTPNGRKSRLSVLVSSENPVARMSTKANSSTDLG